MLLIGSPLAVIELALDAWFSEFCLQVYRPIPFLLSTASWHWSEHVVNVVTYEMKAASEVQAPRCQ